jgi:hypothetical protein
MMATTLMEGGTGEPPLVLGRTRRRWSTYSTCVGLPPDGPRRCRDEGWARLPEAAQVRECQRCPSMHSCLMDGLRLAADRRIDAYPQEVWAGLTQAEWREVASTMNEVRRVSTTRASEPGIHKP